MKIGERGQVTIPQKFRTRFGLTPTTPVEFAEIDGTLVIRKSRSNRTRAGKRKVYGVLGAKGAHTDEIMKALRGL